MNRTLLATVALVFLASGVRAGELEQRLLMSKTGDFAVAPDITIHLEKTGEGNIRYLIKRVIGTAPDKVRTQSVNCEFSTEGGDEFLFYWDTAASMLWMASLQKVMTQRFTEPGKGDTFLPEMVVSMKEFSKSSRQFQEGVRQRFPDNTIFLMIEPNNSR